MPIHISDRNQKLGPIVNISLPPILSCPKGVTCAHEGCYALKAWRAYPPARQAWLDNYEYFMTYGQAYFDAILDDLSRRHNLPFFRWHVSGDIPNAAYLDGMVYIAKALPHTRFLAFTKNNDIDISSLPDNLIIRYSYWPSMRVLPNDTFVNFAGLNIDERLQDAFQCPGYCHTCHKCWSRAIKFVVFKKH